MRKRARDKASGAVPIPGTCAVYPAAAARSVCPPPDAAGSGDYYSGRLIPGLGGGWALPSHAGDRLGARLRKCCGVAHLYDRRPRTALGAAREEALESSVRWKAASLGPRHVPLHGAGVALERSVPWAAPRAFARCRGAGVRGCDACKRCVYCQSKSSWQKRR